MRNRTTHSFLTFHALSWLCLANGIGLLLGILLLAPALNDVVAPFTYGRWIPVHLNGQLYGWCFLPLIGLLFSLYPGRTSYSRGYRWAIELWSIALGFGCLTWLAGRSSGKLFMEWSGASRVLLPLAMLFLAVVLLSSLLREIRQSNCWTFPLTLKTLLWLALIPVPIIMFWAASPTLFPPINPDSGGATGGDLLVSSLGAITLLWLCPFMLRTPCNQSKGMIGIFTFLQVAHYLVFAAMDHGDQSHYRPAEILGLLSLLLWAPLLIFHFRCFVWPKSATLWLWAFACWASFLVVSANLMFLPNILDYWKFTHMIVGHTHTAMAGMLSAFNVLVLISLNPTGPWRKILGNKTLFWLWNGATLVMVIALKGLGVVEGATAGALFYDVSTVNGFFWLRLFAGIVMFSVSAIWLHEGFCKISLTKDTAYV